MRKTWLSMTAIDSGNKKSKMVKTVLSLWPFMLPLLAMIYVYSTSYFGLGRLCDKRINELFALPIVGTSVLSFFWLACRTRNELIIAMTFLNIAFFCREWHFAGTDIGIYIAISLFIGWFIYRRGKIEEIITGTKIKVWLFATASCYLFSQIIARRVFSINHLGLLPLEGEYFVSFEETLEGTAHIMMLVTSIVAWSTFYVWDKKIGFISLKRQSKRILNYVKPILPLCIVLLLSGGFVWDYMTRPYHFKVVKPGILYRSGWMKPGNQDRIIKKYGIRTVVNLCLPEESTFLENYMDEQRICKENDVTIVYIPMVGNEPPSREQTAQWLSLLQDHQKQPILVHCAQGATRTAVMVAVYQMEFLEKDNDETVKDLETFGHELNVPKRKEIYDFISNYESTL